MVEYAQCAAQDQKPLTLALSQRERGLTESDVRDAPTVNTGSYVICADAK